MIWAIPIEVGQDGWSDRAATGLGHSGNRIRVRIDHSDTTYQVGASLGAPGRPGLRPLDSGCNLRLWLLARQELVSQLGIVSEESALNPHYGCVISDWDLKIDLTPMDRGVSGAQFSLRFPAQIVQVPEIAPGSLMGPALLVFKQAGMEPGELVLSLARRGETAAPTTAAPAAKIRLKLNRKAGEDEDVIIWLDRTEVVDE